MFEVGCSTKRKIASSNTCGVFRALCSIIAVSSGRTGCPLAWTPNGSPVRPSRNVTMFYSSENFSPVDWIKSCEIEFTKWISLVERCFTTSFVIGVHLRVSWISRLLCSRCVSQSIVCNSSFSGSFITINFKLEYENWWMRDSSGR